PTLFIFTGFNNPKLEVALCRAYNSFMAKACANSGGRIHFVMMPPLNSVDACIAEMDRCKELGSVGMFFRTMETGRSLGDPFFFPIYQEAARLGLPVCIHLGRAIPNSPSALQGNLGSVSSAFMAMVQGRIPEKFPGLKTGFIEFGSLWVPDALHGMHRRGQMKYRGPVSSLLGAGRTDPQLFKDYGMFLTCYADEPLPFILEYVGEENLIIGSDYSHQDASEEEDLVQLMRSREDVSSGVVEKILCENARNFYPL
ncbi:MAG: amidohydrolase family protein, partial [Chloroflexota bacterium]|nr:amidohydrolase family protein [Chloroflexota bacterium]